MSMQDLPAVQPDKETFLQILQRDDDVQGVQKKLRLVRVAAVEELYMILSHS